MTPQKPQQKSKNTGFCTDSPHNYWVVDIVGIEAEGSIAVVLACTDCGDVVVKKEQVAQPFSGLRMQEEKTKTL